MEKPIRATRKRKPLCDDNLIQDSSPIKKIKRVNKATTEKLTKKKDDKITTELNKKVSKKVGSRKTPIAKASKTNLDEDISIDTPDTDNVLSNVWDEAEMLCHVERIPISLARNFISLLTEGCTLPFIARYRKTLVDHLMPDR